MFLAPIIPSQVNYAQARSDMQAERYLGMRFMENDNFLISHNLRYVHELYQLALLKGAISALG